MDICFFAGTWFFKFADCWSVVVVSASIPVSLNEVMFVAAATNVASLLCMLFCASAKSVIDPGCTGAFGHVPSSGPHAWCCDLHGIVGSSDFTGGVCGLSGGAFGICSGPCVLLGNGVAAGISTGPAGMVSGVTNDCAAVGS